MCAPQVCGGRKRQTWAVLMAGFLFTMLVFSIGTANMPREDIMELKLSHMERKLEYLQSMYRIRNEELLDMQYKISNLSLPPERTDVVELKKYYKGSKVLQGFELTNLQRMQIPILPYLMPHVSEDSNSLRPSFRIASKRSFVEFVIGIPTVKRDKEAYWLNTLKSLVQQMHASDRNDTLIVIFVGETDVSYVAEVAKQIENVFPRLLGTLIEVLSPAASYYPNLDAMSETLGDSNKRFKWRTKQNLDAVYLMGYAQSRGTYYLMLEDDVETTEGFMRKMRDFIEQSSRKNPNWFMLDFCRDGGIGKLFRSTDLLHFITFVQLFYHNMPIDWLLQSYLETKVCPPIKNSKCGARVLEIRPQHLTSLFIHKGTFSSLKGKMHKVKGRKKAALFFPHSNPPLAKLDTNMNIRQLHTLEGAYNGTGFFWADKPKSGDFIEFVFQEPLNVTRYTFRSGNMEHLEDKFYNAAVHALFGNGTSKKISVFDEFGLAEGVVPQNLNPISGFRLTVLRNSKKWLIINEIEIVTKSQD